MYCFSYAEKLTFALQYAMTQLKCCRKDKVEETIKEVIVIKGMFYDHNAAVVQFPFTIIQLNPSKTDTTGTKDFLF